MFSASCLQTRRNFSIFSWPFVHGCNCEIKARDCKTCNFLAFHKFICAVERVVVVVRAMGISRVEFLDVVIHVGGGNCVYVKELGA